MIEEPTMNSQPQKFSAPDGTEMVILSAAEYERLRNLADDAEDVADAEAILARLNAGDGTMPSAVLGLMLDQDLPPIAAWRRYRGMSQSALARAAGLSQVWISRIERGGGYGSRETRRKLAAALDAPPWSLDIDDHD